MDVWMCGKQKRGNGQEDLYRISCSEHDRSMIHGADPPARGSLCGNSCTYLTYDCDYDYDHGCAAQAQAKTPPPPIPLPLPLLTAARDCAYRQRPSPEARDMWLCTLPTYSTPRVHLTGRFSQPSQCDNRKRRPQAAGEPAS